MLPYILMFLAAILFVYCWRYPKFGHWLYEIANWIEARLAGFKQQQITLDGIEHHYLYNPASKDKPNLILIHGFTADKYVWLKMARKLKNDFHIIIPDLAGHGHTGFDKTWDYSIAEQAKRIVQLMDVLNIKSAHLVGNSMGGFISAYIGAHYSDKVDSLTLIDSAGIRSKLPSKMNQMIAQGSNPFLMDSTTEFERFFAMTMARPPYIPNIVKKALAKRYVEQKEQLAQIFADFNRIENMLDEKLHMIQVPTLILWGEKDQLIHVSAAELWQQGTQGQLKIWDDLGHMPMTEAPGRTAHEIITFIQQN